MMYAISKIYNHWFEYATLITKLLVFYMATLCGTIENVPKELFFYQKIPGTVVKSQTEVECIGSIVAV